jgi:flagellar assembly protein FliH
VGKIVRGAKVVDEAYVVNIPEFTRVPQRRIVQELDERFAAPADALAFDDDAHDVLPDDVVEGTFVEATIDAEQIRADARALIDAAATDAEKMLRDAAAHAREMLAAADARVAEIEEQARADAHEEGLAAGREAGRAELEEQVASIRELLESVRAQRNSVIESAEPELVRLALSVAERIVYDHVAIDPDVVLENVRHALTRLIGREVVTLRVNPADLETLRSHRDAVAAGNDVEHLRIVEDQRVDRGGVMIETDAGTIDAKVSTQLREARRALQGADAIAVSPSHEPTVLRPPAQAS